MAQEIQVTIAGKRYETKSFAFPGGELQVQIPDLPPLVTDGYSLLSRLQSPDDIIRLLLTTELLGRVHRGGSTQLVVPYFPYARQDRVMQPGEAFSLKAVARLINGLTFDEVATFDLHSPVAAALIEGLTEVSQAELVLRHSELWMWMLDHNPLLIAPDAGAAKKTMDVARKFHARWNHSLDVVQATKNRDVATGQITGTSLGDPACVSGRRCLILDDICDGGRTFTELAKILRSAGAAEVHLFVTHGIFSQGLEPFVGLIDGIFTTDTFLSPHIPDRLPVSLYVSPIERIRL